VNSLHPPTEYAPETFGLLYAFSIFTHLSLPTQREWLGEFSRILRPGGFAVISVHGDADAQTLPQNDLDEYRSTGYLMRSTGAEGENVCAVYQNMDAFGKLFSENFRLVDFLPAARKSTSKQDVYLLARK
jgi:hypothetical protein